MCVRACLRVCVFIRVNVYVCVLYVCYVQHVYNFYPGVWFQKHRDLIIRDGKQESAFQTIAASRKQWKNQFLSQIIYL